MSLLHAAFVLLLYSTQRFFVGGFNLKDVDLDHRRGTRENFLNDLLSQHLWQMNQSYSPFQENINNKLKEGWIEVKDWPKDNFKLGQASGVSIDSKGLIYVFHRGDRTWGSETFDLYNRIRNNERRRGPIPSPTVIVYDPVSGEILQKWGENMFYMPHGITLDQGDNVWVTDVALHQIFKYSSLKNKPTMAQLTLGEAFIPGNDSVHFCKPTSIAVTSWGDFFVADGYCNSRILKFDKNGVKISEWGRSNFYHGVSQAPSYMFNIPHALTLVEDKGLVCTADRENGRIQCFHWNNGSFVFMLHSNNVGSRLFSLTYSPVQGGLFYVVNGPELKQLPVSVKGSVFSGSTHQELFQFGVNKLQNPHDIVVSPDGKTIFVVEIGPFKVWKYESNDVFNTFLSSNYMSSVKTVILSKEETFSKVLESAVVTPSGILPAVLVTSAALLFAGALLTAALIYSRAKRRGRSLLEDNFYSETKKLVLSEY